MRTSLFLVIPLVAGCASHPDQQQPPGTTQENTPTVYTNVVDAVVVPMMQASGLAVVPEDNGVLCRRMAIDLTGITPTGDELTTQCAGHTPAEMAAYFMNETTGPNIPDKSAPYVFVNRRWWADQFEYQGHVGPAGATMTFFLYVKDLDEKVGDLYAGKIPYDEFAREALGSPAFVRRFGIFDANHDLVQIASQAYRVFLGREALPSEAEDFGNLYRGWNSQFMMEQAALKAYGSLCVSHKNMQGQEVGCDHYEVGLDGSQCAGDNLATCQSTVLGPGQVVPSSPGFVRWGALSAADLASLETPGKLMAAQPEFAEAAVDRSLSKYLGWWKSSIYRPDTDVPAVRDALAKKLVRDEFDIRKMELEIVTSVLYTQRAKLEASQSALDPIWSVGPTKPLYAEAWLDSVGAALAKRLGTCDFRYNQGYINLAPDLFGFNAPLSGGLKYTYYASVATEMGGCPVGATHGDPSGLVPSIARRTVAAQFCPGAFQVKAGDSAESIVKRVSTGLGRPLDDVETKVLTTHMTTAAEGGCDPTQASCDGQKLADSLCTSLYATSLFAYY